MTRPTVIPRIFTPDPRAVTAFMRDVLGAEGDDHDDRPADMRIGGSVVMVSDGGGVRAQTTACLYVYVPDVDAALQRAAKRGALVEQPAVQAGWGDRVALVRDPFGNTWQLATPSARKAGR